MPGFSPAEMPRLPSFDTAVPGNPAVGGLIQSGQPQNALMQGNEMQAQNAQNMLRQAQTAGAVQEVQQKQRGMQLSMVAAIKDHPDAELRSKVIGMANRLNPSLQIDPSADNATLNSLVMSGVPTAQIPEYQMNAAKARFYQGLTGQPNGQALGQPAGAQQGAAPADNIGLSPDQQTAMAIFDPAGSNALTNVQRLQYESPQGKQAISEAEKTGSNSAETGKTLNVMQANLPVVLQRLKEMQDAASDSSYGIGVNNEGTGLKQLMASQLGYDKQNAILQQRAAQGVLPELGPQLAQAGIKGNKFLETLASSASGLNLSASPEAKKAAIDGLREQYISNLKSTARQARAYGQPAPSDEEIDQAVNNYEGGKAPQATGANPQKQGNTAPEGTIIHDGKGKAMVKRSGQWQGM